VRVGTQQSDVRPAAESGEPLGDGGLAAAATSGHPEQERLGHQTRRARTTGQRGSARTALRSGSPSTSDAARKPASAARSSQVIDWSTSPALAQLHATSKAVCAGLAGLPSNTIAPTSAASW